MFTDPRSAQQPAWATRSSAPVHATGGLTGWGPAGMTDHVPASAATAAVVEVGVIVVDLGTVVVEAAPLSNPSPQPATRRGATTKISDRQR